MGFMSNLVDGVGEIMETNRIIRYIIGYIIGISIFVILIPYGIYELSQFHKITFINSFYIRLIISLPIFIIGIVFGYLVQYFIVYDWERRSC